MQLDADPHSPSLPWFLTCGAFQRVVLRRWFMYVLCYNTVILWQCCRVPGEVNEHKALPDCNKLWDLVEKRAHWCWCWMCPCCVCQLLQQAHSLVAFGISDISNWNDWQTNSLWWGTLRNPLQSQLLCLCSTLKFSVLLEMKLCFLHVHTHKYARSLGPFHAHSLLPLICNFMKNQWIGHTYLMMQSLVSMPRDDHTQPFSLLICINSLCIGPRCASSLQDQFLL